MVKRMGKISTTYYLSHPTRHNQPLPAGELSAHHFNEIKPIGQSGGAYGFSAAADYLGYQLTRYLGTG